MKLIASLSILSALAVVTIGSASAKPYTQAAPKAELYCSTGILFQVAMETVGNRRAADFAKSQFCTGYSLSK